MKNNLDTEKLRGAFEKLKQSVKALMTID